MITKFHIENFKQLSNVELELGETVIFIGPNNSGKTSALQAIALWDAGRRKWSEKRKKGSPKLRTGVTINRRDLFSIPVPSAKLLWKNLHVNDTKIREGKQRTDKIYITVSASGVHEDKSWDCAFEFYFANDESLYCRLKDPEKGIVPKAPVVFLPPMSGLAEREYRKEAGEIGVLIGEGQTAQVLRNLCWQLYSKKHENGEDDKKSWHTVVEKIYRLFEIKLQSPQYISERSELTLTYKERSGIELDLSSSGRGCQQVILLLSYILANPGTILLLDEPDAHLEILRQRDVYNLLSEIAAEQGSQIIAASHSEVVLQEAAERDVLIAFVGKPHRIDTRSRSQVKKALTNIPMADYYLAEQKGWLLYLEGPTDLAILRSLANRLNHRAKSVLSDSVPVIYLSNNKPNEARDHFYGLREAKPDLVGMALFDRLDKELQKNSSLAEYMWSQREIENYLVTPQSLEGFVQLGLNLNDLIDPTVINHRLEILRDCINEVCKALAITNEPDPWGSDIKVTDKFLNPLFKLFYERLGIPQKTFKKDYHELADVILIEQIDPEIKSMLDAIYQTATSVSPS
jgi:AAA15 family ATPase/GTPase